MRQELFGIDLTICALRVCLLAILFYYFPSLLSVLFVHCDAPAPFVYLVYLLT